MKTRNVSVPEALDAYVEKMVASGEFSSYSEVVREAIRLLKRTDAEREQRRQSVIDRLGRGFEQAKTGLVVDRSEAG
ncbi:MAG: type II toxin-antitoxin system ParD family antitoxin [Fimbriimonadaceae bacterium]|nr:type II toxin-antitoxin system ParD family antitoxin [Fimbriimonadaceae bacterium]QYK58916.1 MAG: type II toxin-antitoxin system ParD family antitoxin [Fimbriimonadaceae bacterium]